MKIYCVCMCGEHASDEASIEINFRNEAIHFVCPKCKRENTLSLKPVGKPLPRMKVQK